MTAKKSRTSKKPRSKETPSGSFTPTSNKETGPTQEFAPTSSKTNENQVKNFYNVKISWNIGRMAQRGNFCCSLNILHNYHDALARLEGRQYRNIFAQGKGNIHDHSMPVRELSETMRNALAKQNIDLEAHVHQIHLGRAERLFGVIEDGIFHILLFDPDHKGYLSKR